MMDEHKPFGELSAESLQIGDIVEWSTWEPLRGAWESNYGIVMEIKNEIKGNRMVSVSIVVPLTGNKAELEFFTPSLKLISRGEITPEIDEFNS